MIPSRALVLFAIVPLALPAAPPEARCLRPRRPPRPLPLPARPVAPAGEPPRGVSGQGVPRRAGGADLRPHGAEGQGPRGPPLLAPARRRERVRAAARVP